MKDIIQGIVGILVALALIVMAVITIYKVFISPPECATRFAVPDPALVSLILLVDLDEQGVLSERDKGRIMVDGVESYWIYDSKELTFSAVLNDRQFDAEVCFTEEKMEFRNIEEILSTAE